jgi:hypothetical protein
MDNGQCRIWELDPRSRRPGHPADGQGNWHISSYTGDHYDYYPTSTSKEKAIKLAQQAGATSYIDGDHDSSPVVQITPPTREPIPLAELQAHFGAKSKARAALVQAIYDSQLVGFEVMQGNPGQIEVHWSVKVDAPAWAGGGAGGYDLAYYAKAGITQSVTLCITGQGTRNPLSILLWVNKGPCYQSSGWRDVTMGKATRALTDGPKALGLLVDTYAKKTEKS